MLISSLLGGVHSTILWEGDVPIVEIKIDGELLDRLESALLNEMWAEAERRRAEFARQGRYIAYALVARLDGLAVRIWADEHPPPHFHVSYQGEDASFSILDCQRLRATRGLKGWDRAIREWWQDNQQLLVEKWNQLRPTDCPVGPIKWPP